MWRTTPWLPWAKVLKPLVPLPTMLEVACTHAADILKSIRWWWLWLRGKQSKVTRQRNDRDIVLYRVISKGHSDKVSFELRQKRVKEVITWISGGRHHRQRDKQVQGSWGNIASDIFKQPQGRECGWSKVGEKEMRSGSRGVRSHSLVGLGKDFGFSSELHKKPLWGVDKKGGVMWLGLLSLRIITLCLGCAQ